VWSAARTQIGKSRFPAGVRQQLAAALQELREAHQAFIEEAERSHAAGVHTVWGVVVLERPLPGTSIDRPAEVVARLASALQDFEALARLVEATRTLTYTKESRGRILDGAAPEVGIPTPHPTLPELPFLQRAERFCGRVRQAIAALRGATSGWPAPAPDYQGKVDRALAWWGWLLHDETPPPRRIVADVHEAADALQELIREAERRDVWRTPLAPSHVAIVKAIREAAPACLTQVELAAATGLSPRTIYDALADLEAWRMVRRPHGERKGVSLTAKGAGAIAR
jgi:hypothetical protein